MKIIDATNLVLGRLASYAAKLALLGEKVTIVNSEKAVITGSKKDIFDYYIQKRQRREPFHGPFFPKRADRIVRRTVRGMLPYKQEKGRKAFKRVMCYLGVPRQFEGRQIETVESASVDKVKNAKYLTVGELSRRLGSK